MNLVKHNYEHNYVVISDIIMLLFIWEVITYATYNTNERFEKYKRIIQALSYKERAYICYKAGLDRKSTRLNSSH